MSRKWADRALLALFIGMAVLLYLSTASYPGIARTTSARYVRFLAVFIGALSALQLGYSLLKDRSAGRLSLTDHLPRFLGLLAALAAFAVLFERFGFFLVAGVFIPLVAWLLGYRRKSVILLVTLGVLLFVWLVFVQLLNVNLPGPTF